LSALGEGWRKAVDAAGQRVADARDQAKRGNRGDGEQARGVTKKTVAEDRPGGRAAQEQGNRRGPHGRGLRGFDVRTGVRHVGTRQHNRRVPG